MAAKKKSKATTSPFPEEVMPRVPADLARAFADKVAPFEGKLAYGFVGRDSAAKLAVKFDPHAAWDVMQSYGDTLPQTASLAPLATLGRASDECLAFDPAQPKLPVFYFEHERGYHLLSPALDTFLASLVAKGEKLPIERIAKVFDKADKASDANDHAKVISLLEADARLCPRVKASFDDVGRYLPLALNLLGLAYGHLRRVDDAIAAYREAAALGSHSAALNLAQVHLEREEWRDAVTVAMPVRSSTDADDARSALEYLGRAYVELGDRAAAAEAFHRLAADPKASLTDATAALREVASSGREAAALAKRILSWLAPTHTLAPDRRASVVAWWRTVPAKARRKLAPHVEENDVPTDDVLAEIVMRLEVELADCDIDDLTFTAGFVRARAIDVSGHRLRDLESLPSLVKLDELVLRKGTLVSTRGIERAPFLQVLRADGNRIEDAQGLDALTGLTKLSLAKNALASASFVRQLGALVELDLRENPGGPFARESFDNVPLSSLDGQLVLSARAPTTDEDRAWWSTVAKNEPLRAFLQTSSVRKPVEDHLRALRTRRLLRMAGKGLTSLEGVEGIAAAQKLEIANNPIRDLSPVTSLAALRAIDCSMTDVTDLSPLAACKHLADVECVGLKQPTGLASLAALPRLRNVLSRGAFAPDDIAAFRALRPDVFVD